MSCRIVTEPPADVGDDVVRRRRVAAAVAADLSGAAADDASATATVAEVADAPGDADAAVAATAACGRPAAGRGGGRRAQPGSRASVRAMLVTLGLFSSGYS